MIASTSQHLHRLVQRVEQLPAQSGLERVADLQLLHTYQRGLSCRIFSASRRVRSTFESKRRVLCKNFCEIPRRFHSIRNRIAIAHVQIR